jgi:hypothetical protein
MNAFDDGRWIQNFCMDKRTIAGICDRLCPHVRKQDTTYRKAVPVEVRVCVCLYKLAHGANILTYSEYFAIGRSTVGMCIREVVAAINLVYHGMISWPCGIEMKEVMLDFKSWCGLPSVQGAINCTHFAISKPPMYAEDYYYFKTSGYSVVGQAIVDQRKCFRDLYVGLPGSVNDQRVLRRSSLFHHVRDRRLMHVESGYQEGYPPYLLADKGYQNLAWMLTPFKHDGQPLAVAEVLYNRRHRRGRSVVENAFGLLKESWRELLHKTELHITVVPDVVNACCILHNLSLMKVAVPYEEVLDRVNQEARNEFRLREDGDWWMSAAEEEAHNRRIEEGEGSGREERQRVVQYVSMQPFARE